jgi:hypothetical protein
VTNTAIFILFRLRKSDSDWLAALFGFAAAGIVYFHYLFATILPAFVLCFFLLKKNRDRQWRQFGIAAGAFTLAFLPLISGIRDLFHTSGTHVFETAPTFPNLLWVLMPGFLPHVAIGAVFATGLLVAASPHLRRDSQLQLQGSNGLLCASLALIPILILYGVSVATSIHTFAPRHCLVAVPGIALCWAWFARRYFLRATRLLFCVALVAVTSYSLLSSPLATHHHYTWKYALEFAETNASPDNAPVLICSDFPEADYTAMPSDPKTSRFFAPLAYYKLTVPVVGFPRTLNAEAIQIGSRFLQQAAEKHQRFLAMEFGYPIGNTSQRSYQILDWLASHAAATNEVRKLGIYDYIEVVEFTPRPVVQATR